jgi:tRNA modification GTPase
MSGGGDTIFALSSAPGQAGVAVVRVSGTEADRLCLEIAGVVPAARHAALRTLRDPETGQEIDTALLLRFPGPASFTGEDTVEFQVHGGRAVLDALFAVLARYEAVRLAEPGEFSRRAFVNGRLDLTQAEGVADLVAAETEAQRRVALNQAGGALSRLHAEWRQQLLHQLAHVEAWLDFPDEELPSDVLDTLRQSVSGLTLGISAHLQDARMGERLRDGVSVAIIGPPNAGKSTLLNALADREIAIVSEKPGTTRDVLEAHLNLGGWPVVLVDTAGLRESDDAVEREGVRRALARAASADLVLSLSPLPESGQGLHFESYRPESNDLLTDVGPEIVRVVSKADRTDRDLHAVFGGQYDQIISAQTGEGLSELSQLLAERAAALADGAGRVLPTRLRHRQGLQETLQALGRADGWTAALPPELLAEDLRMAVRALGRIAGTVDVEDLLDVIFRDFCIGK